MYDVIVWENEAQHLLWTQEMAGQVSDGCWENARPHNHWERVCDAGSTWAGRSPEWATPGLTFRPVTVYDFNKKWLLDIVGERMLEAVQVRFPDYTWAQMRTDLKAMRELFKAAQAGTVLSRTGVRA